MESIKQKTTKCGKKETPFQETLDKIYMMQDISGNRLNFDAAGETQEPVKLLKFNNLTKAFNNFSLLRS